MNQVAHVGPVDATSKASIACTDQATVPLRRQEKTEAVGVIRDCDLNLDGA